MALPPHLLCIGFGYCARALSRRVRDRGGAVSATCRTGDKAAALEAEGIRAHLYNAASVDSTLPSLAGVSHVLVSVPPDAAGDPVARGAGSLLPPGSLELPPPGSLKWVGYLSTTGVYGDRGGGWVDEESELLPTGDRGRRRVRAEADWLALHRSAGLPLHIFRLAGIYGPGRNQIESLRAGTARRIDKPGQVFSRIHFEDIAATLLASMDAPNPGRVYNLCDDDPAAPADVVAYAARLLGIEPPPLQRLDEAGLSPMARSFYDDNKRVRNERIKTELGVRLRFPTYREGLRALLDADPAAPA